VFKAISSHDILFSLRVLAGDVRRPAMPFVPGSRLDLVVARRFGWRCVRRRVLEAALTFDDRCRDRPAPSGYFGAVPTDVAMAALPAHDVPVAGFTATARLMGQLGVGLKGCWKYGGDDAQDNEQA
jgi:hypothetical protein